MSGILFVLATLFTFHSSLCFLCYEHSEISLGEAPSSSERECLGSANTCETVMRTQPNGSREFTRACSTSTNVGCTTVEILPSDNTVDWMSRVPDATKLNEMSIPGTHNSAAFSYAVNSHFLCLEPAKLFVLCQDWTIEAQLSNGIRFFDVRLTANGGSLYMYHGQCYLNMIFDEFLDTVVNFLDNHPTETVLVQYQKAHGPRQISDFIDAFRAARGKYPSHVWSNYENVPTIGELRGKIFFVNQNGDGDVGLKMDMISISNVWSVSLAGTEGEELDLEEKIESIDENLIKASNREGGKLHLTFTSANALSGRGAFLSILKGISNRKVAEQIEPHLVSTILRLARINQNPIFGIIAMDYPKQEVIANIIGYNPNNGKSDDVEVEVTCNCDIDLCNSEEIMEDMRSTTSVISKSNLMIAAIAFVILL